MYITNQPRSSRWTIHDCGRGLLNIFLFEPQPWPLSSTSRCKMNHTNINSLQRNLHILSNKETWRFHQNIDDSLWQTRCDPNHSNRKYLNKTWRASRSRWQLISDFHPISSSGNPSTCRRVSSTSSVHTNPRIHPESVHLSDDCQAGQTRGRPQPRRHISLLAHCQTRDGWFWMKQENTSHVPHRLHLIARRVYWWPHPLLLIRPNPTVSTLTSSSASYRLSIEFRMEMMSGFSADEISITMNIVFLRDGKKFIN